MKQKRFLNGLTKIMVIYQNKPIWISSFQPAIKLFIGF